MIRYIALIALTILLAGCATTYSVAPVTNTNQALRYYKGTPTLSSVLERSVVEVTPLSNSFQGRPVFMLVAFNDSPDAHQLGVENIEAIVNGEGHRIYTATELQREAERAAAWEQFAVALAAGAQSYANAQAAYSNTYSTYSSYGSATAVSPYGSTIVTGSAYGSGMSTTYNPGVTQALEAQNRARTADQLNQIEARLEAVSVDLQNNVLQTTTILPGSAYGGRIVLDAPEMDDGNATIILEVELGGEVHSFEFSAVTE